jgi:hypothetical protein
MTSEDPNIATLLKACDFFQSEGYGDQQKQRAAIAALASTLAERDRRIAELEEQLTTAKAGWLSALKFADDAPAPAPGELAKAITWERVEWQDANPPSRDVEPHWRRMGLILSAAESWQRLQWRPASEAPMDTDVVVKLTSFGTIGMGERTDKGWRVNTSLCPEHYIAGWFPADALPALNEGDDNG